MFFRSISLRVKKPRNKHCGTALQNYLRVARLFVNVPLKGRFSIDIIWPRPVHIWRDRCNLFCVTGHKTSHTG